MNIGKRHKKLVHIPEKENDMAAFTIEGKQFVYHGQPYRIISGAMHYFRIVPQYWEDRLLKLKACGFNTVETYVAWNLHEPKEGQFNFAGMADIVRFIELAAIIGLNVILRPSPYICAEWEFGGLPFWLLQDSNMRLRCSYKPFLDKVDAYYDVLIPMLKPLLCTNGGPIIAMQIENEYGSYGNDRDYLEYLQQGLINRGIDTLLFTSDGPEDFMLQGGTLFPEVLATVNFGSKPEQAFAKLEEYQPNKPMVCMEYWNGWFDHWGDKHHTRGFADVVDVLDRILESGASVNFYMFHGGTNFGFYNGANHIDFYEPTVTSYDYHALLTESGDITDKYLAIQDVITKYAGSPKEDFPAPIAKKYYGQVQLTEQTALFDSLKLLSKPLQSTYPETMEKLGQDYGFILYTTKLSGPRNQCELIIQDVHDRALVYVNNVYQGVIERWGPNSLVLNIPSSGANLSLLVENMGRINYGAYLKDYKGITEGVKVGTKQYNQFLFNWTIYKLPLSDLSNLIYKPIQPVNLSLLEATGSPLFYIGVFQVSEAKDTFLKLEGWTKGVVYINGFNLGRYWDKGPQKTLYLPGPLLHEGDNEVVIFELHGTKAAIIELQDYAELS
jgi:beta-galactosidase